MRKKAGFSIVNTQRAEIILLFYFLQRASTFMCFSFNSGLEHIVSHSIGLAFRGHAVLCYYYYSGNTQIKFNYHRLQNDFIPKPCNSQVYAVRLICAEASFFRKIRTFDQVPYIATAVQVFMKRVDKLLFAFFWIGRARYTSRLEDESRRKLDLVKTRTSSQRSFCRRFFITLG